MADLVSIPVVDVREGGAVRHATDGPARARALERRLPDLVAARPPAWCFRSWTA